MDLHGWRRRFEPLADPMIAVAVLVLSLLPLLRARDCGCRTVPAWGYALVVAECVPLVWRRRWPLPMAMVAGLLAMGYGVSSLPDPPVPYAGLVALYSAAAHASRRLARLAGLIAAVGIGAVMVADWPNADFEDVTVNYLLFATAWLLGDSARGRRDRAQQLEARADQLERTRAAEADRAVAEERNRIAREMHDIVAHHVSMMVVQAEAGPVVVERDPRRAIEVFDAISATGKQALAEMRRLLGVLRNDPTERLAPQPGADRIPELVAGVRAAGLDIDLEVIGTVRDLPPGVDLSAYRLLQEALTNVLRHAGPARARVQVEYAEDALRLEVVDDGVGALGTEPVPGTGHGLVAMRERVALVGGTLRAGPRPDGGWAVAAVLPLDRVSPPRVPW
jgi:signal transduction histidine kinase